jgi:hypothetical protein
VGIPVQVRTSAILRTTILIAELRTKKSCGTAIADLQNFYFRISATFPSIPPVRYFLVPFLQLRMVLKINQKFLESYVSLKTKNLPERDSSTRFLSRIFFLYESTGSTSKTMPKNAELKLSSCGLEKKLRLWNCGVVVAEQHVFKKLRNCDCGRASFKLRKCDCGLNKKLRVPTSANQL